LTGKILPVSSTFVATPSASNSATVASTLRAASAECRKRPGGPYASTMPRLSVACVMLQRVPPDMRILTPGLRFFSSRRVRRPRWRGVAPPGRRGRRSPAPPAPPPPCPASPPPVGPLLPLNLLEGRRRRLAHVRAVAFPVEVPQRLHRLPGRRPDLAEGLDHA